MIVRKVFFGILLLGFITSASAAQIVNFVTKGNLQSNYDIDCIPISKVKNIYTPADLYKGVAKCIKRDDLDRAAALMFHILAYGRYDAARVDDKTAHQAIAALGVENLSIVEDAKRYKMLSIIEKNHDEYCKQEIKIGKPDYVPTYMIQHGMLAFTGKSSLAVNFDGNKVWSEEVLKAYLHCE
jgi:hypothetical protein